MKALFSTSLGAGSALAFNSFLFRMKIQNANCSAEDEDIFQRDCLALDHILGLIITSDRIILPFSSSLSRSSSSFVVVNDTQKRNPLFTIERLSSKDFEKHIHLPDIGYDDFEKKGISKSNVRPVFFVEAQIPTKSSRVTISFFCSYSSQYFAVVGRSKTLYRLKVRSWAYGGRC